MKKISFSVIIILMAFFANAQLQPTEDAVLIRATVFANKTMPKAGEVVKFVSTKTKAEQTMVSDSLGHFELLLDKGDAYEVHVVSFADNAEPKIFKVPTDDGLIVINYTLNTNVINTFLLDVQFNTNEASLMPESYFVLDQFFHTLSEKKNVKVEIGGHTDNVGSVESNLKLSEQRAAVVKDYLVKKGIDNERITIKGYGDSVPIASNDTPEGRQKNRRTEVKIIAE